jgi:hypothetical protein
MRHGREIPVLRTRTGRTYLDAHGQHVAVVAAGSSNFRDAQGEWQPIRNELVASTNAGLHCRTGRTATS